MTFSESIKALLSTYANCISLLKGFKHRSEEDGTASSQDPHSHLRKSLRSDRSQIERAYSSRLSESGGRLKKGDDRANTALNRVLKRLRNAITNLLRLSSKKDGFNLDYASLMSLSNASRVDAIKTIDGLSRRLGSQSRSTVVSASSKTSSRHLRKSSSKTEIPPSKPSKETPRPSSSSVSLKENKRASKQRKEDNDKKLRKSQPPSPPPSLKSPDAQPPARISRAMTASPKAPKPGALNRVSILSFSSDSTKLGEIPQRKWQSVMRYTETDPDGDEYNVSPAFPLRPYTVEVRERRFWGLFRGRKREG